MLKPRKPDTVYDWVKRYQAKGISGLPVKPGRGRKPAYFPKYQEKQEAKAAILHTVRREPSRFGASRTRWCLDLIGRVCDWLRVKKPSGLSQLLKRLGISYVCPLASSTLLLTGALMSTRDKTYKRGRSYVHSPDPHYQQKMDLIAQCLLKAWYAPQKYALLYQDEFTIYRQPTVGWDYEQRGKFQPLARRSYHSNTEFRGIGALNVLLLLTETFRMGVKSNKKNAVTGQVTYHQASKANIRQLTVFYDMVVADYPDLDTIYMVQDNWPVHFHPDLLIHLQAQHFQFPIHVPSNWPDEPSSKAKREVEKRKGDTKQEKLPIKILQLPTYASWANPIEKLWRWVRQSIIHLHRLSDEWHKLKQRVIDFMLSFRKGSYQLLRYVGLLPD